MLPSLSRGQGRRPPAHLNSLPPTTVPIPPAILTLARGEKSSWLSDSRAMSLDLQAHAFAGHPLRCHHGQPCPPNSALESLKALLVGGADDGQMLPGHKVLPFRKGRPLARSSESMSSGSSLPAWRLGWLSPSHLKELPADSFVYLGSASPEDGGAHHWAIDATDAVGFGFGTADTDGSSYIELRTLMVATDWGDGRTMGELAVAGHAKALLEWHKTCRFCGHCGTKTVAIDTGRRKQCTNDSCKKKIYPRVDPVVIMLVIDKTNDCALLSRQSRYVPRMWSCLAGFLEPGETLEEAVRRETWEETGIEVGDVMYHSSQPWPVGPSSMPCQLMVGFFAYAKSLDIRVDKEELEDAQWHNREDVKKALTFAEYERAQRTAACKVNQMCNGVEKVQNLSTDFNVESGEPAPMFVPGPFAIAHHLISSWVNQGISGNLQLSSKRSASLSNL